MRASTHEGGSAINYVGVAVAAALATAGAAYLFDPDSGNRRRALVRDKWLHAQRQSREFLDKAARDAKQRAQGLYREAASRARGGRVDDATLEQRERAETLQGSGQRRPLQRVEYLQSNWAPAPRVLAGAAAAGLIMGAFERRSPIAYALAAGGAVLMARAISNVPLAELVGMRADEESGLLVQKTIEVFAPPEEVYSCWRDLEQLPRFMSHVRDVRRLDDTRYHWVVDGPAGIPVEWDSEITADVPNELIAWRTVKGTTVHSSGVLHFEPSRYGTRMHIRMSYRPPARALGHTIAKIFGRDPQRQIDDDIMRFKSYIETRTPAHDAARAVRH